MAKKTNTTQAVAPIEKELAKTIYQDLSPEEREARLRETADTVIQYDYNRPYSDEELAEKRSRLAAICIRISDLEAELAAEKAHYKALIQPEEMDRESVVSDLRAGGRMVTEECYIIINRNIGKAGVYNADGVLLNEKDITPDMEQMTIYEQLREEPEEQAQQDEPETAFQN